MSDDLAERKIASLEKVPATTRGKGYNDSTIISNADKAFKEAFPKKYGNETFDGTEIEKQIWKEEKRIELRETLLSGTTGFSAESKEKIIELNEKSKVKIANLRQTETKPETAQTETKKEFFIKTMINTVENKIKNGDSQAKEKMIAKIQSSNSPDAEKSEVIEILNQKFPDVKKENLQSKIPASNSLGVGSLGVGSLGL